MSLKTKKLLWVVGAGVLYLTGYVGTWLLGMVDYSYVSADQAPLFARFVAVSEDGGSTGYQGLGYSLGTHKKMTVSEDLQTGYQEYGAILHFRWSVIFPQVWRLRSNLDFRVLKLRSLEAPITAKNRVVDP